MLINLTSNSVRNTVAILPIVFALIACGDGGNGKNSADTTNQAAPVSVTNETPVKVTIGSVVPVSAKNLISEISGADGSIAFRSQAVTQTKVAQEFPLIVATTENKEIVLASIDASPDVELTANTTALALTRLLLESVADGMTEDSLLKRISSHKSFPSLVDAITIALESGVATVRNPNVQRTAIMIASDVVDNSMQGTISSKGSSSINKVIPTRDLNEKFPFNVLSLPVGSINVTGGLLNVHNSTLLSWSAQSETTEGVVIADGAIKSLRFPDDGPVVMLPSVTVGEWLKSKFPSFIPPIGQAVSTDGINAFNLTISQSRQARYQNMSAIYGAALSQLAGFVGSHSAGDCTAELVQAIYGEELLLLATSPSGDSFVALLESAAKSLNLTTLSTKLLTFAPRLCPGDIWKARGETLVRRVGPLVARLNWLYNAYQVADTVVSAGILSGRVYWLAQYWKKSESFRVCVAGGQVTNCAKTFELEKVTLLVGANHRLEVKAFDVENRLTLVPSSVRFSSSSGAVTIDPLTGRIIGLTASSAILISVTDAPTGAAGTVLLVVDEGKLTPANLRLSVSERAEIKLVSTLDQSIITTGVPLEWVVSDKSIANLLLPAPRGAKFAFIEAIKSGNGFVTVNNPISGKFLQNNFEVTGSVRSVRIISATCTLASANAQQYERFTLQGTAEGDVGSFITTEQPHIGYRSGTICTAWTGKRLVDVNGNGATSCVRGVNEPQSTTWTSFIDTSNDGSKNKLFQAELRNINDPFFGVVPTVHQPAGISCEPLTIFP